MQQASECTSTKSIKRRFLFKLALLSIPRLGLMSLVLLTFGIYMIFPCVSTFLQVHRETSVPFDLSVTADPRNMERLSDIEGVTKITPVCRISAQLKTDTASQSIEVLGVFSSFLPTDFLEGGPFQDDTHTPFLVINEAAAKSFRTEQGNATSITLNTRLTLNDQEALMAGIFRDGSEQPLCYMSYDTAIRGQAQEDQQEFLLTLEHKGDMIKVSEILTLWSIYGKIDVNEILQWHLPENQCLQFLMTAMITIFCAVSILRKQMHYLHNLFEQENTVCFSNGFSFNEIKTLHGCRLAFSILISFCVAFVFYKASNLFT